MRGFSAGDPAGSISGFAEPRQHLANAQPVQRMAPARGDFCGGGKNEDARRHGAMGHRQMPRRLPAQSARPGPAGPEDDVEIERSEEPTSELQSLMRISYAVFCLTKKKKNKDTERLNGLQQ